MGGAQGDFLSLSPTLPPAAGHGNKGPATCAVGDLRGRPCGSGEGGRQIKG